ncbi:MAG: RDD family protein [Acidimicrobiaceae bacterium]|nr:RDD family protein [Acidimicrobiaceae bacterium]
MTTVDGYGSGSIITPEAVVLDFELAGLGSRSIAYAIDIALQFIVLIGFLFFVGLIGSGSGVLGLVILLVGLIVIVLGYSVSMETFNRGRTVGRMVVKTRVVTVEGAPVRFRQAFIRSLLGIVDLLLTAGTVAVVSSLITKRGQRLGDLVAGTMVIRDPANKLPSGALHFYAPHYLVGWAQTVDTQGLGNDGYQLVRDFLTRHDLDESARARLADDVALLVSERLPHAARPLTVPSMDYLTAIATATQGPGAPPPPPPTMAPVIPGARWGQPTTRPAANLPPPPGVVPRTPVANVQPPSGFEPGPPAAVPPVTPTPASHTPVPRPDPPNDGGFSTPR